MAYQGLDDAKVDRIICGIVQIGLLVSVCAIYLVSFALERTLLFSVLNVVLFLPLVAALWAGMGVIKFLFFEKDGEVSRTKTWTLYSIMFIGNPILIQSFEESEYAIVFAAYSFCLNGLVHQRKPVRFILSTIFISMCYSFLCLSATIGNLSSLLLTQIFFLGALNNESSQRRELKNLYSNQSLHMSSLYHEIKTPMNGIVCSTELIYTSLQQLISRVTSEATEVLNSIREYLEIIQVSSISLGEMIENMLSFSKLQASPSAVLDVKPILVPSVIVPLKQLIFAYPKSPDVRVIIQDHLDGDVMVLANSSSLHQVLLNVLTNSLKFTSSGWVKLSVRLENGKSIVFEVSDTGIGMSQSFIERSLFQPFVQENQGIASQRGLGLGMAIAKTMVEKMNGTIRVMSAKGVGTTTTITLRKAPQAFFTAKPLSDLQLPVASGGIPRNGPVKALIVDDNEINKRVMTRLLQNIGFTTEVASSGEESIQLISKTPPNSLDVVFMDVFMPGIGGIEAMKRIQRLIHSWKKPPVLVACTADTNQETLAKCAVIGITQFIHKPINKKELESLHNSLLCRIQ